MERYRILETLKQYGEDKLRDSGEKEVILLKHLTFFKEFAEESRTKILQQRNKSLAEEAGTGSWQFSICY
ncbi:MAG: hypothetical protein IPH77_16625 [Ignavibacteria bacterium]|nr:hypothetical protein [Ignavibacteria bacterium]